MTRAKLLVTRMLPQSVLEEAQRQFEVSLWPRDEPIGAAFDSWSPGSLLEISDVFCVCAPSTPQTRGMLDAHRLGLLPQGAIFVNIARGDLVDEDALIDAIAAGRIGAAGLDVYRNEPGIDPRFSKLPHTTLLPHIGSATAEARTAMGLIVLQALDRWLREGQLSDNCLNPSTQQRRTPE